MLRGDPLGRPYEGTKFCAPTEDWGEGTSPLQPGLEPAQAGSNPTRAWGAPFDRLRAHGCAPLLRAPLLR